MYLKTLTKIQVICLVAFLFLNAQGVWAKKSGPKASFVKGTVEVSKTKDGSFKRLKRNKRVKIGSFVKTGEASRAELLFSDGSVIRLAPNSVLHLKKSNFKKKSHQIKVDTELIGGKAWAKVAKLTGSEAQFEMKSENAVAGVRGTVFRVNIEEDDATVIKVYEGAVAVSNNPFFEAEEKKKSASKVKKKVEGPIHSKRKVVAAPFTQISKDEWEQVVAEMMQVKVGKDGKMTQASVFSKEDDMKSEADWVKWNLSCDTGKCDAY